LLYFYRSWSYLFSPPQRAQTLHLSLETLHRYPRQNGRLVDSIQHTQQPSTRCAGIAVVVVAGVLAMMMVMVMRNFLWIGAEWVVGTTTHRFHLH
jgi:nitrate/nitrite-specific signal transduction histidine kinase